MQFVYQPLAWGFLLVALPLLIHLINLLRYKRTQWAAMRFLLESYRRHRRWVWLKQALLLASRMLAVALLVLLLAQWVSGARWLSLLGQSTTHHYVLLDDSLSMLHEAGGVASYDRAVAAVASTLEASVAEGGAHVVSLIRYSAAQLAPGAGAAEQGGAAADEAALAAQAQAADAVADLLARSVVADAAAALEPARDAGCVDLDVGPLAGLRLIRAMLAAADTSEQAKVYVVSDFRERSWDTIVPVKSALEQIDAQGAELELIDCAAEGVENVSLLALEVDQEVLAAKVPVLVRLTLRNSGLAALRNVTVRLSSYDCSREDLAIAFDRPASGIATALPPLVLESLEPQETVQRSFQVVFDRPGSHVVTAAVAQDDLDPDNRIAAVLSIAADRRVLVVDDTADRRASTYITSALQPAASVPTGWAVEVRPSSLIRDADATSLLDYSVIYLADWNSLDPRAVRNLRGYLAAGGGLGIFAGGDWNTADLLRVSGQLNVPVDSVANTPGEVSLLPAPLAAIETTAADSASNVADGDGLLTARRHPVFEPLLSLAFNPLQFVRFDRLVTLGSFNAGRPAAAMADLVGSPLGGEVPVMLETQLDAGRLVLSTFALDGEWTNWPQDPSFVVTMLKLTGYLSSGRRTGDSGASPATPIRLRVSPDQYLPAAELIVPSRGDRPRSAVQLQPEGGVYRFDPALSLDATQYDPLISGVRELWLTKVTGGRQVFNFAANAEAADGDLRPIDRAALSRALQPLEIPIRGADELLRRDPLGGGSQSRWLLLLLVTLLLAEQLLAYAASYHLPAPAKRTA